MSRSRARLAADWFAKLRQNAVTNAVEHTDVTDVSSVSDSAVKPNDSPTFNVVTATAFAGDGSALTGVLSKKIDIGGSADLNTYTTDGYYHQNSNSSATSGTNYPANLAGMLTVMADGNMVYQKYQTYNGSGTYQRTKYSSTWYSWDKVLDSGNLTTTGTITSTALTLGTWTITDTGGVLTFSSGSGAKFSITAAGAITAADNVTAYGTP
jgi:hypothetical protein